MIKMIDGFYVKAIYSCLSF